MPDLVDPLMTRLGVAYASSIHLEPSDSTLSTPAIQRVHATHTKSIPFKRFELFMMSRYYHDFLSEFAPNFA